MTDENETAKQFIYVEPMGHGLHFVAEVAPSTIVPGSVQLNVLRGDGGIDRTIGMTGTAIFRWTSVSREMALIMAAKLDQERNIWNVTPPERLLIEAARAQTVPPPTESEGDPRMVDIEDYHDGEEDDDDGPRAHGSECTCAHCIQDHPERDPESWEDSDEDEE